MVSEYGVAFVRSGIFCERILGLVVSKMIYPFGSEFVADDVSVVVVGRIRMITRLGVGLLNNAVAN